MSNKCHICGYNCGDATVAIINGEIFPIHRSCGTIAATGTSPFKWERCRCGKAAKMEVRRSNKLIARTCNVCGNVIAMLEQDIVCIPSKWYMQEKKAFSFYKNNNKKIYILPKEKAEKMIGFINELQKKEMVNS